MAKKKQAKREEPKAEGPDPKRVHELLGIVGPYGDYELPIPTKNFVTWWDPGMSLLELRRRKPELFSYSDWLDSQPFAKLSDSWKFRQVNLTPVGLGEPCDPKTPDLPLVRELVCYLLTHVLLTGERREIGRLRCKDVLPSGQRVVVGPWRDAGLEIANVSDRWSSPDMGCCALYTPIVRKK